MLVQIYHFHNLSQSFTKTLGIPLGFVFTENWLLHLLFSSLFLKGMSNSIPSQLVRPSRQAVLRPDALLRDASVSATVSALGAAPAAAQVGDGENGLERFLALLLICCLIAYTLDLVFDVCFFFLARMFCCVFPLLFPSVECLGVVYSDHSGGLKEDVQLRKL